MNTFQREVYTWLDSFGRNPPDALERVLVDVSEQGPRRGDEVVQDGDVSFSVYVTRPSYSEEAYAEAFDIASRLCQKAIAVEFKRHRVHRDGVQWVWTWVVTDEDGPRLYDPESKRNRGRPAPEREKLSVVQRRAEVLGVPLKEVE